MDPSAKTAAVLRPILPNYLEEFYYKLKTPSRHLTQIRRYAENKKKQPHPSRSSKIRTAGIRKNCRFP